NWANWFFNDAHAKRILPLWSNEAPYLAGVIRGMLARYRDTAEAKTVLAQLNRSHDFRRYSASAPTTVHYGRRPEHPLHVRDSSGHTTTSAIQVVEIPDMRGLLLVTARAQSPGTPPAPCPPDQAPTPSAP